MYMEVGYHLAQGNPAHFYTATKIKWLLPACYIHRNIISSINIMIIKFFR